MGFTCLFFSSPKFLETTSVFTVCIVLHFPEVYIIGIIEHIVFLDCLLYFTIAFKVHPCFSIAWWLTSVLLLNNVPLYGYTQSV